MTNDHVVGIYRQFRKIVTEDFWPVAQKIFVQKPSTTCERTKID